MTSNAGSASTSFHHQSCSLNRGNKNKGSSTSSHHEDTFLTSGRKPSSSYQQQPSNHHHRHHSMSGGVNDFFDDSCSSLSSTPSSATTVTSSSSSSTSDSGDLLPQLASLQQQQQKHHHHHKHSKPGKTSSKTASKQSGHHQSSSQKTGQELTLNDLNLGSPAKQASSGHSSQRRQKDMSKKSSSNTTNDSGTETTSVNTRNSTPSVGSENWTTFHFGPNEGMTHPSHDMFPQMHHLMSNTTGRLSPRAASEHYASLVSLDQKMKTSTIGSSSSPNKTKAVAIIKGTASVSRLSSNSFSHGTAGSSSSDWKKHLHSHEIRKLKRELDQSNEKVASLTSQLATHSHMVTAFEQSLASMSLRLQQLQSLSSQKDCEMSRLKNRIEELKMMQRFNNPSSNPSGVTATPPSTPAKSLKSSSKSKKLEDSGRSSATVQSGQDMKSLMVRRHTFVTPLNPSDGKSSSSGKDGRWFRAFRRSKNKTASGSVSDNEGSEASFNPKQGDYAPSLASYGRMGSTESFSQMGSTEGINMSNGDPALVTELKRQLREKEKTLTDLRLEALASAHQVQSLEELVSQLRSEVTSLKNDNDRMARQLSTPSCHCSHDRIKGGTSERRSTSRQQHQGSSLTGSLRSRTNDPTYSGSEWQATSSPSSSGEDHSCLPTTASSSGYASGTSELRDSQWS